jgi:AcrR family transcriptional regulator
VPGRRWAVSGPRRLRYDTKDQYRRRERQDRQRRREIAQTAPAERITARAIARESGANPSSITYHFGSKDSLVTEAAIAGLDRWLDDIAATLGDLASQPPAARLQLGIAAVGTSRRQHTGLARNYIAALAKAPHAERIRALLADGLGTPARTSPRS